VCLALEESIHAIYSVEQNAGLTGLAISFWENVESGQQIKFHMLHSREAIN